MTRAWMMFDHPIKLVGGEQKRGFNGAHLADADRAAEWIKTGEGLAPLCGMDAVYSARSAEPLGFVVACTRCLALSEVPSNG